MRLHVVSHVCSAKADFSLQAKVKAAQLFIGPSQQAANSRLESPQLPTLCSGLSSEAHAHLQFAACDSYSGNTNRSR